MKLTLSGYARSVYIHTHEIIPFAGKQGQALQWRDGSSAQGRVMGLGLTGDFNITVTGTREDLQNWLWAYARENPEAALRMMAPIQTEAIIQIAQAK